MVKSRYIVAIAAEIPKVILTKYGLLLIITLLVVCCHLTRGLWRSL